MPLVTDRPIVKHEFKTPNDMIEKQRELRGITTPLATLVPVATPIVGTWVNCNHETGGLVRVVIAAKGNGITVHAFGACHPTPCDWGIVDGLIYADSVATTPAVAFTTKYKLAFVETTLVGHLYKGVLFVETFEHFTDNSGRADYYSLEMMSK